LSNESGLILGSSPCNRLDRSLISRAGCCPLQHPCRRQDISFDIGKETSRRRLHKAFHRSGESIRDLDNFAKVSPYLWSSAFPHRYLIPSDFEHPGQRTSIPAWNHLEPEIIPRKTQQTNRKDVFAFFVFSYICFSFLHPTDFPNLRNDGSKTKPPSPVGLWIRKCSFGYFQKVGNGLRINATRADHEEVQLIQKSPTPDTIMLIMYPRGKTLQAHRFERRH
jgi:hypothetical protein